MAHDADDKLKIIQHYRASRSVTATCNAFGLARQTLYNWLERYDREGEAGLVYKSRAHRSHPQKTPTGTTQHIVELALAHPTLGGTELANLIAPPHSRVSPQTVNSILRSNGVSTIEERFLQLEQTYHFRPALTTGGHPWAKVIRDANPRYRDYEVRGSRPGEALTFGVVRIKEIGTLGPLWMACIVDTYSSYTHAELRSSKRALDAVELLEKARQFYSGCNRKMLRIRIHKKPFFNSRDILRLCSYLNYHETTIGLKYEMIKTNEADIFWRTNKKISGFILHFSRMAQQACFEKLDRRRKPSLNELQERFAGWLRDYNESELSGYPTMGKSPLAMVADRDLRANGA